MEMSATSPKERRQARIREAILEAARDIIAEEGADGLSMRAIAQRIDYSPAGLYEYFGGKDDIIGAVCEEGNRQLFAYMDVVDKDLSPADYLRAIGHAYIRFAIEQPDYFLLMFSSPSQAQGAEDISVEDINAEDTNAEDISVQNGDASAFGLLLDAIRRGVAEGVFQQRPGFDVMAMAYAAWATVHGLAMLRVTHLQGYPMDFDAADKEALLNFGRGLMSLG